MHGCESNIYSSIIALQSSYRQTAANAGQFYLIFSAISIPILLSPQINLISKFIIALFGFAISIIIPYTIISFLSRTRFLYGKLSELESLDAGQADASRVLVFSLMSTKGGPRETTVFLFGLVAFVLWTAQVAYLGFLLVPELLHNYVHLSNVSLAN